MEKSLASSVLTELSPAICCASSWQPALRDHGSILTTCLVNAEKPLIFSPLPAALRILVFNLILNATDLRWQAKIFKAFYRRDRTTADHLIRVAQCRFFHEECSHCQSLPPRMWFLLYQALCQPPSVVHLWVIKGSCLLRKGVEIFLKSKELYSLSPVSSHHRHNSGLIWLRCLSEKSGAACPM